MTRRPNTLDRRASITDAMIRLLARNGLPGATMQALAREARLTQGLLHYHFGSREEIVLAAVNQLAEGIEARVARAEVDPAGKNPLGALIAALLGTARADPEALRAWLAVGDAAQRDEPVRLAWAGAIERLRARVEQALPDRGPDAPPGQPGDPDGRAALAGLIVAAVEGAWRVGLHAPGVLPAGTAAPTLARLLGTSLPEVPASPPVGRRAHAPARLTTADLGLRLPLRERRWLDRVIAAGPSPAGSPLASAGDAPRQPHPRGSPDPQALPVPLWHTLAAAYMSPGRHYHTPEHLAELAERYTEIQAGPGWDDPAAAWLALLFHDAVYTVDMLQPAGENERRSAALLLALVPGAEAAAEIIRATADHLGCAAPAIASRHDLDHFLDADLSILGASPARFDRYERQVAAEYVPFVGAELYRAGRAAFLAKLLASPVLFRSDWGRTRFEAAARRNLSSAVRA